MSHFYFILTFLGKKNTRINIILIINNLIIINCIYKFSFGGLHNSSLS
jgi:hypothetical protein